MHLRAAGLNHKGVFTRLREPKLAAHRLRQRWGGAAAEAARAAAAAEREAAAEAARAEAARAAAAEAAVAEAAAVAAAAAAAAATTPAAAAGAATGAARAAADAEDDADDEEGEGGARCLVLVGVTGDGKSSTGNTLCSRGAFEVSASLSSVTSSARHADFLCVSAEGDLEEFRRRPPPPASPLLLLITCA